MRFYHFSQNNSGGGYSTPAKEVFIEAANAVEANEIALQNGIYFNGVAKDIDCDCCGDRWYPVDNYDFVTNDGEIMERCIESPSRFRRNDGVPHSLIIRKEA
jgi:hypothetical protein